MSDPTLQLTLAVAVNAVTVELGFSSAFVQSVNLLTPNNYAFSTRFGTNIPVYTKSVEVLNSTTLILTLQDAMLDGGAYQVAVTDIYSNNGVHIEKGGANTLPFVGVGDPKKVFDIKGRVYDWLNTAYGSVSYAVLAATGNLLNDLIGDGPSSAVNQAAQSLLIRTATGEDLTIIGQNYGVVRPEFTLQDDDLYRAILPILAAKPKCILATIYAAMEALLGPQQGDNTWKIFEVHTNDFVIEIPNDLLASSAVNAGTNATILSDEPISLPSEPGVTPSPPSVGSPSAYFAADSSVPGAMENNTPVILFEGISAINDIINLIKAAGITYSVVLT